MRDALARAVGQAYPSEERALRRLAADSLHITLCFLGSRPPEEVPRIASAIDAVTGFPAPALRPAGPLWLPPRRPRVLAVGLEDIGGGVGRVQSAIAGELERRGIYQPERRPFRAHVTVARVRQSGGRAWEAKASAERLERDLAAHLERDLAEEPFVAGEVILFCSRLGPRGARYEPLYSVLLRPGS